MFVVIVTGLQNNKKTICVVIVTGLLSKTEASTGRFLDSPDCDKENLEGEVDASWKSSIVIDVVDRQRSRSAQQHRRAVVDLVYLRCCQCYSTSW